MPTITKTKAINKGIPKVSLQTILFSYDFFDYNDAIDWLIKHGYRYDFYRTTKNFMRFMQVNPIQNAQFSSKKIASGINFVFQKY